MLIHCVQDATNKRFQNLQSYLEQNVLDHNGFRCTHGPECRQSHAGTFLAGQLHHLGKYYDLEFDGVPMRIAVVGQEYGHGKDGVSLEARYNMIMSAGEEKRFKSENGKEARNPHMRGTTSVLRLLHGKPLGTDYEGEFVKLSTGATVHLFDTFALVDYLLCSATCDGSMRGRSTDVMKQNCKSHFQEVMSILEPTVIIVQGKGFWSKIIQHALGEVQGVTGDVYRTKIGSTNTWIAALSHPSARGQANNWGCNHEMPYLLEKVQNAVAIIRKSMLPPKSLEGAS